MSRGLLARRQAQPIHAMGCRCASCQPGRRAARCRAANHFAQLTFIGLALGLGAAFVIDRIVGGPGLLAIFGVNL